ncbi:MAG: hypothetical protein KIS92_22450 [Planctomycetota bacterium]|nr:hypothetical protein [Planctomycetota bacterium]
MNGFLSPMDIQIIGRDYQALLNGPDSTPVILRWKGVVPADLDGVYQDAPATAPEETLETRAHITVFREIVNASVRGSVFKDAEKAAFGDIPAGDAMFLFKKDVALEGKQGLIIDVPGLGKWHPELNPPAAAARYAVMYHNAELFIQWIYGRAAK